MRAWILLFFVILPAALPLTSCESAGAGGSPDVPSRPLAAILEDEDNAFDKGMVQTGIVERLRKPGSYTLFVPDSNAFTRVLEEAGLTEEEFLQLESLEEILGYHVVIGELYYPNYEAGEWVPTLAGLEVKLQATDQNQASAGGIRLTSTLDDVK